MKLCHFLQHRNNTNENLNKGKYNEDLDSGSAEVPPNYTLEASQSGY